MMDFYILCPYCKDGGSKEKYPELLIPISAKCKKCGIELIAQIKGKL